MAHQRGTTQLRCNLPLHSIPVIAMSVALSPPIPSQTYNSLLLYILIITLMPPVSCKCNAKLIQIKILGFMYFLPGDALRWTSVLSHTKQGNVSSGSKLLLLYEVKHGASVRIMASNNGLLESYDTKNVYWDSGSSVEEPTICTQTYASFLKQSPTEPDENKGAWQYNIMCTNGVKHQIIVAIGNDTDISIMSEEKEFTWFIKRSKNGLGNGTTEESLQSIQNAFMNGHSFLVAENASLRDLNTLYFEPGNTGTVFYAQTLDNVRFNFSNTLESIFDMKAINYDGTIQTAPWPIEGKQKAEAYKQESQSIQWYADDTWEKILVSNETGQALYGSHEELITAALSGRTIRFICSMFGGLISQIANVLQVLHGNLK